MSEAPPEYCCNVIESSRRREAMQLLLCGKPQKQSQWDAGTQVQSSGSNLMGAACHFQDGTEYRATKRAHMTSTSAHINHLRTTPLDTSSLMCWHVSRMGRSTMQASMHT